MRNLNINTVKAIAVIIVAFCIGVSGYLFWEHRNFKEPIVVSEYITEVKKLSDYSDVVKGTANDSNVYIFDSGVEAPTRRNPPALWPPTCWWRI